MLADASTRPCRPFPGAAGEPCDLARDVTNALNDLESRGLVTRSVDPTHRRRNIVTINQNGTAILADLDKVVDDVQEAFLAPLTAAQQRQLLNLMSRLLAERS
jgi:DNA-binding MarR family transcriptional regulator